MCSGSGERWLSEVLCHGASPACRWNRSWGAAERPHPTLNPEEHRFRVPSRPEDYLLCSRTALSEAQVEPALGHSQSPPGRLPKLPSKQGLHCGHHGLFNYRGSEWICRGLGGGVLSNCGRAPCKSEAHICIIKPDTD